MTFIYHVWSRFWPYFNTVDFRAYFGRFSHVKKGKYKMPKNSRRWPQIKKMQENKPTPKFNHVTKVEKNIFSKITMP